VPERLGERIKRLRTEKGWLQKELALKTGFSTQKVSNIERGYIKGVSNEDILKLANVFGVSSEYILRGISSEVTIKDARVEDNATADHLEITMANTGKTDLKNFDIYYTITDKADKTQESYYQTLNGLTLAAGETKTIHFDNQVSEAGHYYGNMSGLYGTSSNGLTFDVQLHAAGFKPMNFTVEKAKGTAEVAD
jgi:transcriptional regulator with XRE-family HTH domain